MNRSAVEYGFGAVLIILSMAGMLWNLHAPPPDVPRLHEQQDVAASAAPSSFEECRGAISRAAARLRVAPISLIETTTLRVVRFCTIEGSVLVTCSRPNQTIEITQSHRRTGCD